MYRPIPQEELHPDAEIISALGGPSAVARACGVTAQTVSQTWKRNGISKGFRLFLKGLYPEVFARLDAMAEAANDGELSDRCIASRARSPPH